MQADNICKLLADQFRQSFLEWRLGLPPDPTRRVELENVEFPANPLRADTVFLLPELRTVFHIEFQTTFDAELPFRMLNYYVRLYNRYRDGANVIIQEIFVLKEGGSQVVSAFARDRTRHEFSVVEIWQLDGQALLAQEATIPFAALGRWQSENPLAEIRARIERIPSPVRRADISVYAAVFASLKFDKAEVARYLPITEDVMLESPIYQEIVAKGLAQGLQQGLQQGVQQGLQQGLQQALQRVLAVRFAGQFEQQTLADKLARVRDAALLNELLTVAVQAQDLQEFNRVLATVLQRLPEKADES